MQFNEKKISNKININLKNKDQILKIKKNHMVELKTSIKKVSKPG
jgi:hypothetical protein